MLSEKCHFQRLHIVGFHSYVQSGKSKNTETENRSTAAKRYG